MMYHNGILCIELSPLQKLGIVSKMLWDKWQRDGATLVQKGGNGRKSLIAFDTIPQKYQEIIRDTFGDVKQAPVKTAFKDEVVIDTKALACFSSYLLPDGRQLATIDNGKHVREYSANANVLNAIHAMYTNQNIARKALGGNMRGFWKKASEVVNDCRVELGHNLPSNFERLRKTYLAYKEEGYSALVSKKFCNDNTQKVTADLERLLMSLYVMPVKPFQADVYTLYNLFLAGKIQAIDTNTGELFTPDQFITKNGEPLTISKATVTNYLNKVSNRVIVDSKRSGSFEFNNQHRPHHHRKSPVFSFSKISMDDRDLPRKCSNGGRVKAYYAYDVASGCVIGRAYSMSKDEELFLECMRDMFRLIERNKMPFPLQVEVENHLVNKFFNDLYEMFPYVRICNPGNSQEKRAEHFNKAKKYQVEKKTQTGIGRWWAKSEAYRIDNKKVNDEFVEKVFTYDSLVADDIAAVNVYNNQLHPRQKQYPGKTRFDVLLENLNQSAFEPNRAAIFKSIGFKTETTIRRNHYCRVQYADYQLPDVATLDKLAINDYKVVAYYLPDADGVISEVCLFQDDKFLCIAERIEKYNEANAEWEAGTDDVAYTNQSKYVSSFDKKVKEGKTKLAKITVIPTEQLETAAAQEVTVVTPPASANDSLADILSNYNAQDYEDKALNDI